MTLTISCKIQSAFFWYIFILTNIHIDKLYSNDGGKEAPQDGITFSMTCSSCRVWGNDLGHKWQKYVLCCSEALSTQSVYPGRGLQ